VKSAVVAGLTLSLVVTGCGQQDSRPLSSLQAMPEAQLVVPGAVSIADLDFEQTSTIEGQQNAETGHEFGLSGDASEVTSYYNQELGARGWQPSNLNAEPATTETAALAWQKGQVVFRLSFRKRGNDPRLPSASDQARFTTIYRAVLIDHPESSPAH
jgi:hypothetical protein